MDTKQRLENARMVHELAGDEIKRLMCELAEAEKPKRPEAKLRHGDYGSAIAKKGTCDSGVRSFMTGRDGIEYNTGTYDDKKVFKERRHYDYTVLGNIFDDLAAMQEDLTEFETRYGGETIYWGFSPQCNDLTFTTPTGTHIIRSAVFHAFILDLRRMEQTLRRKNA